MQVVGRERLEEFAREHADARLQMDAWLAEVLEANWQGPADIKKRYASASFLGENKVVFNLKGNKYRLLAVVAYKQQVVVVSRIGTHAEYSEWDLRRKK
jgi:mRNA interferase HigB